MGKLENKVALVTGGASGIGLAIASGLAEEGARVWVADLKPSDPAPGLKSVNLDVTDLANIKQVIDDLSLHAGPLDILINAAGVYGDSLEPWLKVTEAGFDKIIDVNMRGLLFMTQVAGAHMIAHETGGTIVNIASTGGRRGDPNSVAYSASKAAVISLTQSAALAFAPHGIRVNAIAPGPVLTPMWESVLRMRSMHSGQPPDDIASAMVRQIPLGRSAQPSEMVGAAVFLASQDSSYITGQTLNVDGGRLMN
jgi:galactitol 2-dehydrogenase